MTTTKYFSKNLVMKFNQICWKHLMLWFILSYLKIRSLGLVSWLRGGAQEHNRNFVLVPARRVKLSARIFLHDINNRITQSLQIHREKPIN